MKELHRNTGVISVFSSLFLSVCTVPGETSNRFVVARTRSSSLMCRSCCETAECTSVWFLPPGAAGTASQQHQFAPTLVISVALRFKNLLWCPEIYCEKCFSSPKCFCLIFYCGMIILFLFFNAVFLDCDQLGLFLSLAWSAWTLWNNDCMCNSNGQMIIKMIESHLRTEDASMGYIVLEETSPMPAV